MFEFNEAHLNCEQKSCCMVERRLRTTQVGSGEMRNNQNKYV